MKSISKIIKAVFRRKSVFQELIRKFQLSSQKNKCFTSFFLMKVNKNKQLDSNQVLTFNNYFLRNLLLSFVQKTVLIILNTQCRQIQNVLKTNSKTRFKYKKRGYGSALMCWSNHSYLFFVLVAFHFKQKSQQQQRMRRLFKIFYLFYADRLVFKTNLFKKVHFRSVNKIILKFYWNKIFRLGHAVKSLWIYNYYSMGTTQGKVKDSFSLKPKPILKKNQENGQPPLYNAQIQTNKWSTVINQDSSKTLKYASRIDYPRKCSDDLELSTDSQIQNKKEYPYCSVGVVMYEVGGHKRYGTGFLIGKNIVLTCAHNLFSLEYGQRAINVCFSPSYSKNKQKQVYIAKQIFFPKQFQALASKGSELFEEEFCRNDFGIIMLEDQVNLQQSYGFLGYKFASQQHSLTSNKIIMGFTHTQSKRITLQSFQGKVKFTEEFITYPFPTQIGMSGGPVLQVVNGKSIVIGINTFFKGKGKESNGQGIRLTQQKFDQINSWLQFFQEVIDLRDKNLGKQGVKQLVKQQKYSFDVINLSKNCLQKEGLKHFSRVQWPNLYNLDLGGNNLGNEGIGYLIKSPIKNLQVLNLWGNKIGRAAIQILVEGKWPKLQNLNLYNNEICVEGLQILVWQDWKFLTTMNLGKNKLNMAAIQQLKKSKWKNILCLNLWGNSINNDKKIVEFLHLQFPRMKYLYL